VLKSWTLIVLLLCANRGALAEELQIYTEYAPKVAFERNGRVEGFLVEIVREMQRRTGDQGEVRMIPWARSAHLAQEEPNVLLFPVTRTEEREHSYQWVGTISTTEGRFFARAGSGVAVNSLEEAKSLASIGVPRGFYTEQELTRLGFANLDRVADIDQLFKKLLAGRESVVVIEKVTAVLWLREHQMPEDLFVPVYTFMKTDFELAFSLKTPPEIVARWQKALAEIKADGTYERMYRARPDY